MDEVYIQLEKLNYPKLHTNVDALESEKSYSYLVSMQFSSLTVEKIDDLTKESALREKEYNDYKNTPIHDIWRREIYEFLETYKKWLIESEKDDDNDQQKEKTKGKRVTKKK